MFRAGLGEVVQKEGQLHNSQKQQGLDLIDPAADIGGGKLLWFHGFPSVFFFAF